MITITLNRVLGAVSVVAAVGIGLTYHDNRSVATPVDPIATADLASAGTPTRVVEPPPEDPRTSVRNPFSLRNDQTAAGQRMDQLLADARLRGATATTGVTRRRTATTGPTPRPKTGRGVSERRTKSPFERSRHYQRNRSSYESRDRGAGVRATNPRVRGQNRFRRYY